jgi:hypothetical protein
VRKLLLVLSCTLAAVLLAACGDDEVTVSRSGTTETNAEATTTTTADATTTSEAAGPALPRGCSPTRPSSSGWPGPAPDPATGVAAVDAFNAFLPTVAAPLNTSPCDAAKVFVKADALAESGNVDVEVSPDNAASANVTVTIDGLEDDSVAGERWVLQFAEQPDGSIRLAAAQRTVRCQPGRGHEEYSAALCV